MGTTLIFLTKNAISFTLNDLLETEINEYFLSYETGSDNWSKKSVRLDVLAQNLGVRHVQGKNYKKLKKHKGYKSTSKTKDEKPS